MRWTWMTVLVLASGCDSIDLRRLVPQHEARTRISDTPSGEYCPHGGRTLHAGLDLNDNGVLDDDEVTSTEYVCATPTAGVLVHMQAVSPGETCPHGGHVSRAGQDVNANGVLEDDEVSREVHACTELADAAVLHRTRHVPPLSPPPPWGCSWGRTWVEAGPDSNGNARLDDDEVRAMEDVCAPPAQLRVLHAPELASATCPEGGTRVLVGVDASGDGVLDGAEIFATAFVCKALHTFHGNYTVRTASDLAALQRISRIQGSLWIDDTSLTELSLPGLAVVDGTLRLWNNQLLTRVALPGLRFVGEDLDASGNPALAALTAGGAEHQQLLVGRSLVVINNDQLRGLSGLQSVSPRLNVLLTDNDVLDFVPKEESPLLGVANLRGSLTVTGNGALRALPFSNLFHIGGSVSITGNQALLSLEGLNPWTIGGSLAIIDNELLSELSGLSEVRHLTELSVEGNRSLVSLAGLRALSTLKSLRVADNASLMRFDLEALREVDAAFEVQDNARLPSCLATALAASVYTGDVEQLDIRGNDDTAPCGD
ncbi:DUF7151 family protein [Myxococcus sp. Y35]|uniref:DUF7151 family protein n=1 Tax=Pseudomyxococcus flavus TaxID=3115648 RepID=UPI003CF9012F